MGSKRECRETRYRKAKIFQPVAAKLLHVTKRTRPDIEDEIVSKYNPTFKCLHTINVHPKVVQFVLSAIA